jgi:hypothetical protein
VGIVDTADPDQRSVDEILSSASGHAVHLTIEYVMVPRMLSEDCQILLGYASSKENAVVEPLGDSALIRVVDDTAQTVGMCGASSAGVALSDLVRDPSRLPLGMVLPPAKTEALVAATIVSDSAAKELQRLRNACEWGLVSERLCELEENRLREQVRYEIENYPTHQWDFATRELYRPESEGKK